MSALDHGRPAAPWPPPTTQNGPVPVSSPAVAEIVEGFQALRGDLMHLLHELEADLRRVGDDGATS
jgi:hypothetical protein